MATIKEIAARAGVSVGTVSRALNGYPDVSSATRARIVQLAEELHYYPSAAAQHLVTNRTYTVGVFFSPPEGIGLRHPFVSHVLTAFAAAVGREGYDCLWFSNTKAPFDRWGMIDRVRHRAVDGVLLVGQPRQAAEELMSADIPIVAVDFVAPGRRAASVTSDNRRAMQDLVVDLAEAGYRQIAYLHGPLDLPPALERLQGFYAGMAAAGCEIRPEWIAFSDLTVASGSAAAARILAGDPFPDAIACVSDLVAIGTLQAIRSRGLRVPEDIGVIGFDDIDAASYSTPPLTTIRQQKDDLGRVAAELLTRIIADPNPPPPEHLVLPTELIVRESTRPLGSSLDQAL